jgi:hypothetical protein
VNRNNEQNFLVCNKLRREDKLDYLKEDKIKINFYWRVKLLFLKIS